LASQGTSLAVLKEYVTHLKGNLGAEPGSLTDPKQAGWMRSIQEQIHLDVNALVSHLGQGISEEAQPVSIESRPSIQFGEVLAEDRPVDVYHQSRYVQLLRIHDTLEQIAEGVGAR
jgi:hypothetical protein